MNTTRISLLTVTLLVCAACGKDDAEAPAATSQDSSSQADTAWSEPAEIEPGLTRRVIRQGSGETAVAGQTAVVHYTGWLYDPDADDHRGKKFDSSVDRKQHFRFVIGAGHVIQGWDRGVAGMQVGEVRELTIAPELAYGERGAGDIISPGATLVFEVELAALEGGPAPDQESAP
jgi:FKBP-type peptidyl-prolyl cis-trans isomerase